MTVLERIPNIRLQSTKSASQVVTLRRGMIEEMQRISLCTGLSMDRLFGIAVSLFLEDASQALSIPEREAALDDFEERVLTQEEIDTLLNALVRD
ncbi:MAG: hypothetical protein ING65_08255 [Rhodocyclaceae bacterium]|nr:hypothetical protein [Rhodocyclaceae bacterium]